LFLARVDGKSPVEYLTEEHQRDLVRATAVPLLVEPFESLFRIVAAWRDALSAC
jgi:hypothetical protein